MALDSIAIRPGQGIDLSIRLDFAGLQPNLYGVEPATAQAYEGDGFVGDTRRGGSCNFDVVKLIPHCHGTHTECVGHISRDRIHVNDVLHAPWMKGYVVTVTGTAADATLESYQPPLEPSDRVITAAQLTKALQEIPPDAEALIIRTHPNATSKRHRAYLDAPAPFFTNEAMQAIVARGFLHLLVDLPSVDRAFDEGLMSNHHLYWGIPQGPPPTLGVDASSKTITELIFVPDDVPDGLYIVHLQLAPFSGDAVPSRPILYPC